MSSTLKDKAADAGHAVADAAKTVGHKIAEGAEKAVDFVKDKTGIGGPEEGTDLGISSIKERMDVIALCGKKIGVVDHVEASSLKLTKKDSPDGQHHFIPFAWINHVDKHVHLTKNSKETEECWKSESMSCGCG
jgi:hypothetical protein